MSDKLLKKTPQQVWLAGLGALATAEQEGSDLFQKLVRRGRKLDSEVIKSRVLREMGQELPSPPETNALWVGQEGGKRLDSKTVAARQRRRNELAREAFLKEFGLPWSEKAEFELWEREGKIFTVAHQGTKYLSSFQFDEKGLPRPAVADVLRAFGGRTSNWGLALWWTANSGWLGGRRPVDLLNSAPERVVQAAESEASEVVF